MKQTTTTPTCEKEQRSFVRIFIKTCEEVYLRPERPGFDKRKYLCAPAALMFSEERLNKRVKLKLSELFPKRPVDPKPPNHGAPWTAVLRAQLAVDYRFKVPLDVLAERFGRTPLAVAMQLEILGVLSKTEIQQIADDVRKLRVPQCTGDKSNRCRSFAEIVESWDSADCGYDAL